MQYLYSIVLEMCALNDDLVSATTGHQAHALFLDIVQQIDPVLSARLHDDPHYRPFTISALGGAPEREGVLTLQSGHVYRLRITLLDGGPLWQCLSTHFLAAHNMNLHLGKADFLLQSVLATAEADPTGWAGYTDWQTLASATPSSLISLRFASPCAFSLGDRNFALFPEPILVWDSLMRAWNLHAPDVLQLDKQTLREFIKTHVTVSDYQLHTCTLHFPKYIQKGFTGTCTYAVKATNECASQLTALANFARFSGIGYKTTMGMGQARVENNDKGTPS